MRQSQLGAARSKGGNRNPSVSTICSMNNMNQLAQGTDGRNGRKGLLPLRINLIGVAADREHTKRGCKADNQDELHHDEAEQLSLHPQMGAEPV
jgi:hypothetical protein